MKVLGIDPGSRITGYGVVESVKGGGLLHLAHGDIVAQPKALLPERLLGISDALKAIIEQHRPDAVAVEAVFHAKNVKSAIMLGHARGVCLVCAAQFGVEVFEYSPTTIKQAVVGYGAATKDQVGKMVQVILKTPLKVKPDAADALATAICHINHSGPVQSRERGALSTQSSRSSVRF